MAIRLPKPDEAGGAVWVHEWHSYQDYRTVHESHFRLLEEQGLLIEDGLSFDEVRDHGDLVEVRISGRLLLPHGITVQINKTLEVRPGNPGPEVQGLDYSYHAWFAEHDQDILRYDTAHSEVGLHCHVFDLDTGEEKIFEPLRRDQLPSLDGFIRIVCSRASAAGR